MGYYRPLENPTSFRKIAASMWRSPNDPHIFGSIDIEMTAAQAFLEEYNRRNQCKATVTHLVVRALGVALSRHPELNAKIEWSRILLRNRVDIFCQVAVDGGRDLSGTKIEDVDHLSVCELANKLGGAARAIREDKDPAFRKSRSMFKRAPLIFIRAILWFMSLLTNKLNLHLPGMGAPRDPFGSAMVTSVGMMGIDTGFAPLTPIARCPIIIAVMRLQPRPWVVGDRVEPRPVLRLCGTFDHRIIDGAHAGLMSREVEVLLSQPEELLTEAERGSASRETTAVETQASTSSRSKRRKN